jgi:hypothetical protein
LVEDFGTCTITVRVKPSTFGVRVVDPGEVVPHPGDVVFVAANATGERPANGARSIIAGATISTATIRAPQRTSPARDVLLFTGITTSTLANMQHNCIKNTFTQPHCA